MHVFKYSPRKGTVAAKMSNQIDPIIKEERSNKLIQLSNKNEIEFLEKYIGKEVEVLFESSVQDDYVEGHTTNYIEVKVKGKNLENTIHKVQIEGRKDMSLNGKLTICNKNVTIVQ